MTMIMAEDMVASVAGWGCRRSRRFLLQIRDGLMALVKRVSPLGVRFSSVPKCFQFCLSVRLRLVSSFWAFPLVVFVNKIYFLFSERSWLFFDVSVFPYCPRRCGWDCSQTRPSFSPQGRTSLSSTESSDKKASARFRRLNPKERLWTKDEEVIKAGSLEKSEITGRKRTYGCARLTKACGQPANQRADDALRVPST